MFWKKKKNKIWKEYIEYDLVIWFIGDKLSYTIKRSSDKEEIEKDQATILSVMNSGGKVTTIVIKGALVPVSELYMFYNTEDTFFNITTMKSVTVREKIGGHYIHDSPDSKE